MQFHTTWWSPEGLRKTTDRQTNKHHVWTQSHKVAPHIRFPIQKTTTVTSAVVDEKEVASIVWGGGGGADSQSLTAAYAPWQSAHSEASPQSDVPTVKAYSYPVSSSQHCPHCTEGSDGIGAAKSNTFCQDRNKCANILITKQDSFWVGSAIKIVGTQGQIVQILGFGYRLEKKSPLRCLPRYTNRAAYLSLC